MSITTVCNDKSSIFHGSHVHNSWNTEYNCARSFNILLMKFHALNRMNDIEQEVMNDISSLLHLTAFV